MTKAETSLILRFFSHLKPCSAETPGRISYIDTLRGIAMVVVVSGHMIHIGRLNAYFSSFNMMLFFFISGLFLSTNKHKNFSSYAISKIRALYIPFIFCYLIMLFYWFFVEKDFRQQLVPWEVATFGLLWGSDYNWWLYPGGALWFLPALFSAELLAYPLLRYLKVGGILSAVFCLYCVGAALAKLCLNSPVPHINPPMGLVSAMVLFPYMIGGYLLKRIVLNPEYFRINKLFVIGIAIILMYFNIIVSPLCVWVGYDAIMYALVPWLGIASWFLVARVIGSFPLLECIGRNTLPILAFHQPILRAIRFLVAKCFGLDAFTIQQDWLIGCLLVILTLIICIPIVYAWKYVYPRLLQFIGL